MSRIASALANFVVSLLPVRSDLLYRFCRKIVNRHDGDNDGDMHTNGELTLMRRHLPSAGVVFDVGANVGEWTAVAVGINPRASYHCFEPSPATFAVLAKRGFPANVRLNNFGLSSSVFANCLSSGMSACTILTSSSLTPKSSSSNANR